MILKDSEYWSVNLECGTAYGMCVLERGFCLLIFLRALLIGALIWAAEVLGFCANWRVNLDCFAAGYSGGLDC